MEGISDESTTTAKFPSGLLFFALMIGVGFAFSLLFVHSRERVDGSEIRIVNASNVDFVDVVVGGINYGNIEHGQATGYQHWETAYRYSSVSLKAEGKSYSLLPYDYVGEKQLGAGSFAYLLKFGTSGELEIEVRADESKSSNQSLNTDAPKDGAPIS